MSEAQSTVLTDPELLELFAGDPELLAIADAVAATTPRGGVTARFTGHSHFSRLVPQRRRWLVFAVAWAASVTVAPAFAFPSVRALVGLDTKTPLPPAPYVVATAKVESIHRSGPYALPKATIDFTVGERGKPPGTGIRRGAYFLVFLNGPDKSDPFTSGTGRGTLGHYRAIVRVPNGGIRSIQIGGFMNAYPSPANGGKFWIPVKIESSGDF